MKKYLTPALISCVCLLAFGPLLPFFWGPDWRAKWKIAWAANEYLDGHPDKAEESLKQAALLSHQIATEPEYWNLKFDLVFNKEKPSSETIATLCEDSVALISRTPEIQRRILAYLVGEHFHLRRENEYAVKIMEKFFPPISKRSASENNFLAYARALSKSELQIALTEVDAALVADGTARTEFLDTKAWVLHGLGRDKDALTFIEESIKKLHSELKQFKGIPTQDRGKFERLFEAEVVDATKTDSLDSLPIRRLDELKKEFPSLRPIELELEAKRIAVVRFHRACILDELGRTDESELDYRWLDQFGFTEPEKLN